MEIDEPIGAWKFSLRKSYDQCQNGLLGKGLAVKIYENHFIVQNLSENQCNYLPARDKSFNTFILKESQLNFAIPTSMKIAHGGSKLDPKRT